MLTLAIDCGRQGGVLPIVFNAANEVAVARFLNDEISYLGIHAHVVDTLNAYQHRSVSTIDDIIALDTEVKLQLQVS